LFGACLGLVWALFAPALKRACSRQVIYMIHRQKTGNFGRRSFSRYAFEAHLLGKENDNKRNKFKPSFVKVNRSKETIIYICPN
jgi:putative hemolysin